MVRMPVGVQLGRGDRADPPEPLDRQRVQELLLAVRRHPQQAVGLADGAGHLGEVLGAGDADRDRQPDLVAHPSPQRRADRLGIPDQPAQPADVEERLVDRDALDQRRGVVEDLEDRAARLDVRREARRHHERVRAQPLRLPPAHRRLHAVRLGLVARGEHDAAADDHRAPAQPRVVALLDGGEERVEVGVQDARRLAVADPAHTP